MPILFLSLCFPPKVNAPANRTVEHCREWVLQGHEVHLVTGFPSHPAGKIYPGYAPTLARVRGSRRDPGASRLDLYGREPRLCCGRRNRRYGFWWPAMAQRNEG